MSAGRRPNILLITSDQQRHDCYGFENPHIRTPHLDRLASQGTRFSACITPNLVCQPSRASILTGQLPLTHGVWDNGVDLDPALGEAGFAGTLARSGYQTAFIGKAHFSTWRTFAPTGTPEDRHSVDLYEGGWMGPYMGFEHAELSVLGHMFRSSEVKAPVVGHYENWFVRRGEGSETWRLWGSSLEPEIGAAQTWHSALPLAWHGTTWTTERAIDWLGHRDADKPFCMWVSYGDPHHPFDCPAPWSYLYDPADMPLPRHRIRDLDRRAWWHRASLESEPQMLHESQRNFRAKLSRMPDQTDAQLAAMTANYYGMISMIDDGVGRVLARLQDLGLDRDTLVVFTTDHGELLGNHGLYLKHPIPYEDLLRIGMIMRGPGVAEGGVVREPVSTLDLSPTFLDLAGVAPALIQQGTSLRPLAAGEHAPRDVAYSEWHVHPSRCGVPLKLRTVRTRTHKATFELESGAGELYDLVNDPEEMNDVFADPAYRGVRDELEQMMRARPGPVRDSLDPPIGMA
ncbi:MAG: sulfatase-like hydrolase/transferase [Burkholderiaceae bacterium]|nr:sulfatase-like hydrolase/transferase [Burkholderiaceae bacterium]